MSGRQDLLAHHRQLAAVCRHSGEAQKGGQAKKMVRTCDMPNVQLPFLRIFFGKIAVPKDQAAQKARKTKQDGDQEHDTDDNETDEDHGDAKKSAKKAMKTKKGTDPENGRKHWKPSKDLSITNNTSNPCRERCRSLRTRTQGSQ